MFRRGLAKFCLPCGGETEADDVSEFDSDTEYFVPKDFHLVKARLRAQRHKELVSRLEVNFQRTEPPPASSDVTAVHHESQEERRSAEEEPHQEGDILQEPQQNGPSVQVSQMEEVHQQRMTGGEPAAPSSGREREVPPTERRPRVCWQRRAVLRPRRRLFYPPNIC